MRFGPNNFISGKWLSSFVVRTAFLMKTGANLTSLHTFGPTRQIGLKTEASKLTNLRCKYNPFCFR